MPCIHECITSPACVCCSIVTACFPCYLCLWRWCTPSVIVYSRKQLLVSPQKNAPIVYISAVGTPGTAPLGLFNVEAPQSPPSTSVVVVPQSFTGAMPGGDLFQTQSQGWEQSVEMSQYPPQPSLQQQMAAGQLMPQYLEQQQQQHMHSFSQQHATAAIKISAQSSHQQQSATAPIIVHYPQHQHGIASSQTQQRQQYQSPEHQQTQQQQEHMQLDEGSKQQQDLLGRQAQQEQEQQQQHVDSPSLQQANGSLHVQPQSSSQKQYATAPMLTPQLQECDEHHEEQQREQKQEQKQKQEQQSEGEQEQEKPQGHE